MFTSIIAAVVVQLGVSANQPIHSESVIDYREDVAAHLRVGGESLYAWGSLARGDHRILGQNISDAYTLGAGVGYRMKFNDTWYSFVEAGIGYPHNKNNKNIQQEVAYTYLVGRHNVEDRPIPVDVLYPYDQDSYSTTWDIDYGFLMKVGFGYKISEHWDINLNYKYFNPKGLIEIYDEEARANGLGWWQEYVTINMNVVELGLMFEF